MTKYPGISDYIEIEGFRLQYRIEGKGIPAIVIGSSIFYSRSFSQNLRNYLKLIFMDWRGFVEPPINAPSPSFDALLDDIECLRKKLSLNKVVIIGHSAHALMALEYAKKFPDHVTHVIMIGISPKLDVLNAQAAERNWQESVWPERKTALEERMRAFPDSELAKLPPSQRFVQWYIRRDPQAWFNFHFNSSFLWEDVQPNMTMFDYLYGVTLRDIDITQGLDNFNHPVFLGLGRYDFIVAPPGSWDPFRQNFQNLTVRIFERSGHSPQYEEPELFDAELLHWLSIQTSVENNLNIF